MTDIVDSIDAWDRCYPGNLNIEVLVDDAKIEITRLRQLLSEADKRERELVAMLNSADESRLFQIRRAEAAEEREKEARNVALDDAANIVNAVSHEGLHNSMWRYRFESVAASIRAMKSGEI